MDDDKKDSPETTEAHEPAVESHQEQAPADALSMTPDELAEEEKSHANEHPAAPEEPVKKLPLFVRLAHKVNIYLLIFILIMVIAGIVTVVLYLNSKKVPTPPDVASQNLTSDDLKKLANTDVAIGDHSQTLTIKGNAIIGGQTLARGDLNVAGNLQTGGTIKAPNITISGTSNLGTVQINTLQVAGTVAIKGDTSLQNLAVSGTSTFNGAMTASKITVTDLVMSGNARLTIPNHIEFSGPTPTRTISQTALGGGGSVSIGGSDTSGTATIRTGNNPAAGCFVHITFHQVYSNQPHVIISPVNEAAGRINYYVTRDTQGFSICTANAASGHKTFAFDYFVTN